MSNSSQLTHSLQQRFREFGDQVGKFFGSPEIHLLSHSQPLRYLDGQCTPLTHENELDDRIGLPVVVAGATLGKLIFISPDISSNSPVLATLVENLVLRLELDAARSEVSFLSAVLDNVSEGVVACDGSGMLKLFNKKTREFHGVPEEAIPPEEWAQHYDIYYAGSTTPMAQEDIPLYRAFIGEVVKDSPMVIAPKGRGPLQILTNGRALFDEAGMKIGAVATMRDETELRSQLGQLELRFKTIFEQAPLSIQILSRDGKTLLVNPAWKEMWGISEEVIRDYILTDYNILEDPVLEAQGVAPFIRKGFGGEVSRIPIIKYDPKGSVLDGRTRWVEGLLFPLIDPAGNLKELVLIHLDVTEREQLLTELSRERNQFEAVLKNIPTGVLVLDRQSNRIILTNRRMEEIQGTATLGQSFGAHYVPKGYRPDGQVYDADEWPIRRSLLHGEVVSNEEMRYVNARGVSAELVISSAPVLGPDDQITAAVAVVSDISEAKAIEKRLSFLAKLTSILITSIDYDQITAQIADACTSDLADGCILDLVRDQQIHRLTTRHRDPKIQRLMEELQEKYPPHLDSPQPTARVIRSGEPELLKDVDQQIIRARTFDADHSALITAIDIRSHIAVPMLIRGTAIGSINLLITSDRPHFTENDLDTAVEVARRAALAIENSQLYRRAQKAILQRDEFISIASHELKTPITSMKLQLQLANRIMDRTGEGPIDRVHFKKVVDVTNRQLDRITVLVEDMLDIARIASGKLGLDRKPVDLSALLRENLEAWGEELHIPSGSLTLDIADGVVAVCDGFRIEQVVSNLLTNAIRYGNQMPVRIELRTEREDVLIKVIDQGTGIAPVDLERIFERFERAVPSNNISGLGLGLFISRQIMEQHGGTLTVESVPGVGSTFIAGLPRNKE